CARRQADQKSAATSQLQPNSICGRLGTNKPRHASRYGIIALEIAQPLAKSTILMQTTPKFLDKLKNGRGALIGREAGCGVLSQGWIDVIVNTIIFPTGFTPPLASSAYAGWVALRIRRLPKL